jgi:hypothetical protein
VLATTGKLDALREHGTTRESEACLPDVLNLCYRLVPGRVAVEKSTDGGDSWELAWGLGENQQGRLDSWDSGWYGPAEDSLGAIAVASVEDGYVVIAATGPDGVLIRDAAGTWMRVGVPGEGPARELADTPRIDRAMVPPALIGLGFGSFFCLFVLSVAGHPRRPRVLRSVIAAFPLFHGVLSLTLVAMTNVHPQYPDTDLGDSTFIIAGLLVAGVLSGLVGILILRPFTGRRVWLALLTSLGVGLITAIAAMPTAGSATLTVLAVVVWAAATAGAVGLVRRTAMPAE